MTLKKPSECFRDDVEPNYLAFLEDPTAEWLANNAADAIARQIEWAHQYYIETDSSRLPGSGSLKAFRDHLSLNECPDLQLMWDLGAARKHRILTRNITDRIVTSATSAYSIGEGHFIVDGQSFDEALKRAVDFWRHWLD